MSLLLLLFFFFDCIEEKRKKGKQLFPSFFTNSVFGCFIGFRYIVFTFLFFFFV